MWKVTHSESGQWLSYQDGNKKIYARETHDDKEWKIFKRTNGKNATNMRRYNHRIPTNEVQCSGPNPHNSGRNDI